MNAETKYPPGPYRTVMRRNGSALSKIVVDTNTSAGGAWEPRGPVLTDEMVAVAKLFAAAPKLLAQLNDAARHMEAAAGRFPPNSIGARKWAERARRARAVIAEAKGE